MFIRHATVKQAIRTVTETNARQILAEKYTKKRMGELDTHNYLWFLGTGICGDGYNENGDYFPWSELVMKTARGKYVWATWIDKPLLENHEMTNKRGYVADSTPISNHKSLDFLNALERNEFPNLSRAIESGAVTDTSMGCFPIGTLITVKEGFKPIEYISVGDLVKTHCGIYKKVVSLFSKDFYDGIYEIKVGGVSGSSVLVTHEHPFYTIRKEQLLCSEHLNILGENSTCHPLAYLNRQCQAVSCGFSKEKEFNIEWIKTQDLKVGDYIAYVFNDEVEEDENATKEFARFLGYYLSDGCYTNSHGESISFGFGINEENFVKEIIEICSVLIPSYQPIIKKLDNMFEVSIYNTEFASKVLEYAGRGKTKKLCEKVMKWKKEVQLELLGAYINGDGFQSSGQIYCESINTLIIEQLKQIACRNRIIWSEEKMNYKATEIYGMYVRPCVSYRLRFGKYFNDVLATVSNKVTYIQEKKRWSERKFYYKNFLFSPISSIVFDDTWEGKIYNFEVEEDNSYVAGDIVVHNCLCEKGVCSVCGNTAYDESEWCEHIRDLKGKKTITGEVVYEINYGLEGLENSIISVGRGAEPLAKIREIIAKRLSLNNAKDLDELDRLIVAEFKGFCKKRGVNPDDFLGYLLLKFGKRQ